MADRRVNVLIDYTVNSAQVQKAADLLARANQASNQFQQSAQRAGQTTSQSFGQASKSIEGMELELAQLRQRIKLATDPQAIAALSKQFKDLKQQIDSATKSAFQLPKAINETDKSTKSLASQFGQLYTAAKLFLTAGIVRETVSMTLEMAKLAGNVEGVERAFNRAFSNPQLILENLKSATHGTVTEFELMQRTLQATNLGVNVKELPILFEFAATRAQQTGESVDYLVDSIVRGIGRKSLLILDNLGLSATRLKEQFNGASLASQSVADVTKGVAEIARVELEKMGGYAETSATKVSQLTVAFEELRVAISKKLETSSFIDFLKGGAEGLTMFIKGEQEYRIELLKSSAAQKAQSIIEGDAFKQLENNQQKRIDFIQQEINTRVQSIGRYNDQIKKLAQTVDQGRGFGTGSFAANIEGVQRLKDLTEQYGSSAKKVFQEEIDLAEKSLATRRENRFITQETIKILMDYLKELSKVDVSTETPGLIEDLQQRIQDLGEAIVKAKTEPQIAKLNVQLAILKERLQELKGLGTEGNKLLPELPELKLKFALPDVSGLESETLALGRQLGNKMGEGISQGVQDSMNGQQDFLNHLRIAVEGQQSEIASAGIDIFADQLISLENAEIASLQNRLNNLRNFYDQQILLAGDNDRAKAELRLKEEKDTAALQKRIAEKERKARMFSIIVDTAAGIAKAFATSTTIYEGIVNAAIVAAQGASQLAIVSRTPARFAKGGLNIQGPGTGTSDSIPAQISKGESVMTAQEWKTSKGVLKAVRAKTLDDKVLNDLKLTREGVKYVGMDDKNIVKEIRELRNSIPDVEERAGLLYKTRRKTENYKQWIRLSSMSK